MIEANETNKFLPLDMFLLRKNLDSSLLSILQQMPFALFLKECVTYFSF